MYVYMRWVPKPNSLASHQSLTARQISQLITALSVTSNGLGVFSPGGGTDTAAKATDAFAPERVLTCARASHDREATVVNVT